MPNPQTTNSGAGAGSQNCSEFSVPQPLPPAQPEALHPQHKTGFLPAKGIPGSALQSVSDTLYRYIAKTRPIDQTSTKRWRIRMRKLQFQIFRPEPWSCENFDFEPTNNGYVTVLGSDGKYYYLPKGDLKPEGNEARQLPQEVEKCSQ